MSDRLSGPATGLLESLSKMGATLVALVHTRLDLLAVDLEEEREYQLSQLILIVVALFFLGVGVVLGTLFFIIALWDTQGLYALGAFSGAYLAIGAITWAVMRRKAQRKPRLFATSLTELLKDGQQFGSRHGQ